MDKTVIPIVSVPTSDDADREIHGCAELEPYALRVIGDSMEPEFLDGHVIVLDPGLTVQAGAFVVARVGVETVFRQYCIEQDRRFLRPLNGGYPTLEVGDDFRVLGVVVQRVGKRRADRKRYDE